MTRARRFLLLALVVVAAGELWAAMTGALNQLDSIVPPASTGAGEFTLRFASRPEFVRVPLENTLVLVLDFIDTLYPRIRTDVPMGDGPIRSLSVTQFARDRVRLSLKLAERGKVEIFRRQRGQMWELTLRVLPGLTHPVGATPFAGKGTAIIVLDAGHGGHDEGARGRWLREKQMTLDVALAAKRVFDRDPRLRTYVTRSTDRFVTLEERSAFAGRVHANLFISVHANSTKEGNPSGVEVYFLSLKGATSEEERRAEERENAADAGSGSHNSILDEILDNMVQTSTLNQSSKLANIVQRRWCRATGQHDRGVRQAAFRVLKPIDIPSILIECGFISNPREERVLADPRFHEEAAGALYQSVIEYLTSAGQL